MDKNDDDCLLLNNWKGFENQISFRDEMFFQWQAAKETKTSKIPAIRWSTSIPTFVQFVRIGAFLV